MTYLLTVCINLSNIAPRCRLVTQISAGVAALVWLAQVGTIDHLWQFLAADNLTYRQFAPIAEAVTVLLTLPFGPLMMPLTHRRSH